MLINNVKGDITIRKGDMKRVGNQQVVFPDS
jgi:hypothetical protein